MYPFLNSSSFSVGLLVYLFQIGPYCFANSMQENELVSDFTNSCYLALCQITYKGTREIHSWGIQGSRGFPRERAKWAYSLSYLKREVFVEVAKSLQHTEQLGF